MTESTCPWYVKKLTQMKTPLFQTQEQSLKWYEAENNGLRLMTDHGSTFTVTQNAALVLERAYVGTTANASTAALLSCSHTTSSGVSYSVMRAVHSPLHPAKPAHEKGMRWHLAREIRRTDTQARHLESLSAMCKTSSWRHTLQVCPYRRGQNYVCVGPGRSERSAHAHLQVLNGSWPNAGVQASKNPKLKVVEIHTNSASTTKAHHFSFMLSCNYETIRVSYQ